MDETEFRERMIAALAESGMSVAELARRSGVTYDVINKLKRRENRSTTASNASKLAATLGIPLSAGTFVPSPSLAAMIDVYDVRASAGNGSIIDREDVVERLSFPPDYLHRLTKTAPKHLAIIGVKGDSMDPTLKDDDLVMLDTTKTSLDFDGLFVLRFGDALHVKRIGRAAKGAVRIISDNAQIYPPIDLPREEVEVVGKVIWMGKKV